MDLDVGGLKFDIEANLKKFDKDLRSAHTKAGKFGAKIADGISRAKAGVTRLVKALAKVTVALTTIAAIGLGKLTKDIISASSAMEQWRTQIRVLVKDQEKSNALIADLVEFADKTPFLTSAIVDAGKQMLAFGFEAAEVNELLRDAGNLAAGMGKEIDMIAGAFGRIRAGDFGESMEILRRAGISKDALKAQGLEFSAGGQFEGTWQEMMAGVQAVIRERFPDMMKEMAGTFDGLVSTLKSKWELFRIAIGEKGFLENVKKVLKDILEQIEKWKTEGKLEEWAKNISDWLSRGLKGVTDIVEALTGVRLGGDVSEIGYDMEAIDGVAASLEEMYKQRNILQDLMDAQTEGTGLTWMADVMDDIDARIGELTEERDKLFEGYEVMTTPPWAQAIIDAIEWVKERIKEDDWGAVLGEALATAIGSEQVKNASQGLGREIGGAILAGIGEGMSGGILGILDGIIRDAQEGFYLKWKEMKGEYVPGETVAEHEERVFGKTQMDQNMSVQFSE